MQQANFYFWFSFYFKKIYFDRQVKTFTKLVAHEYYLQSFLFAIS
jgi:hypothetical protein